MIKDDDHLSRQNKNIKKINAIVHRLLFASILGSIRSSMAKLYHLESYRLLFDD